MNIKDIEKFSHKNNGKIYFNYDLKKTNWFNIGGKSKIFFKPEKLEELIEFLKIYKSRGKIFVIGAGSNVLISDELFDGVIIKLGRNFSKLSLLDEIDVNFLFSSIFIRNDKNFSISFELAGEFSKVGLILDRDI